MEDRSDPSNPARKGLFQGAMFSPSEDQTGISPTSISQPEGDAKPSADPGDAPLHAPPTLVPPTQPIGLSAVPISAPSVPGAGAPAMPPPSVLGVGQWPTPNVGVVPLPQPQPSVWQQVEVGASRFLTRYGPQALTSVTSLAVIVATMITTSQFAPRLAKWDKSLSNSVPGFVETIKSKYPSVYAS